MHTMHDQDSLKFSSAKTMSSSSIRTLIPFPAGQKTFKVDFTAKNLSDYAPPTLFLIIIMIQIIIISIIIIIIIIITIISLR